jgi:hypothetical protein
VRVEVPAQGGTGLRLVDFASAGSSGSRYRSWLTPVTAPPPPVLTEYPRDGERLRPGLIQFQWRAPRKGPGLNYRLEIAADAEFHPILHTTNILAGKRAGVELPAAAGPGRELWWRVVTCGAAGETIPAVPAARFVLDAAAAPQALPPLPRSGPQGELIQHSLRGDEAPAFGAVLSAKCAAHGPEGTWMDGRGQMIVYEVPVWPAEDFTVAVRLRISELPSGRIGQVFSAWAAGGDDPLRLVVDQGRLYARVEGGGSYSTPGVALDTGAWHHVAATREGAKVNLFVDGKPAGSCTVPESAVTASRACALGGNPRYGGDESLAAAFADFGFWERALSAEEIRGLAAAR